MQIRQQLPPNFDLIRIAVNPPADAIFCFGEDLYNPSGQEIPEDVLYHESIHTKQQGKNPGQWWNEWINNKDFRYEQELEAYTHQYHFIKKHYPARAAKEALTDLARNLKTIYGLNINLQETESKIRNKAKLLIDS